MILRNKGARLLLLVYRTAVFLLFGSSPLAAVLIGIGAGWYCRNPAWLRVSPKSAADPVGHFAV